jgi:hypothetical protein
MKPIVIDGFLSTYEQLREYANTAEFVDEKSPADGVVYPRICRNIPDEIAADVGRRLSVVMGRVPAMRYLFLRDSPKNVAVPHKVHTDNVMGSFSLMLYLFEMSGAGTGFAEHKTEKFRVVTSDAALVAKATADQNDMGRWNIWGGCESARNRACIFPADWFHVALPVGGFGTKPENSRVVLTAFFD